MGIFYQMPIIQIMHNVHAHFKVGDGRSIERGGGQGQKKIAIILPKNRDTAIFNRLYIKLYIKFVPNNGKNRDSAHAAISFRPWGGG